MDERSATELIEKLDAEIGDKLRKLTYWSLKDRRDAEEVIHDVWLAAWEAAIAGKQPQRWAPWLWRVCENKICDVRKRKRRRREDPTDMLTLPLELPQQRDPHNAYAVIDARDLVVSLCRKARDINAISRSDLTAILLYALDFSDQEAAEVLGLHPSSVKGKRQRALERLRELLQPKMIVGRAGADSIASEQKGTLS
ncbi:RNA polymerase sigma factor [Actinoplanes couchii]|uniref:RNA polymerase sigma-70 region 2 domain-containing protein n=1 Tax=Actinoplanes couchii TaxID=403638 RepID=A0ABQ3XT46_9ACTN|nr:RNA polymerase sigma factor [Actinoplanes couchii]MDR6324079.1 RNA polymerase sigma factor (sigma-70 family) [Actinoplanes couchii]GID61605.1 hypothetical protein Aco03nite_100090 [Actinoplanes couchii]